MTDKDKLIGMLGRTQLVKDVEKAAAAIVESKRQLIVRLRQSRQEQQRIHAEFKLHLDDIASITGLSPESKLFWEIAGATIGQRLRRLQLLREEISYRSLCGLMDGFDDEPMGDLPSDDDIEAAIKRGDL